MIEGLAVIATGAGLGLASIPHCVGMCGGIAAACGGERGSSAWYQGARLISYASIGALAGLALGPVRAALPSGAWAYVFAAITAGALLVSALRLLRIKAPAAARVELVPTDALTRRRAPRRLLPIGLGLVTGLLPCGALYGALAVAAGAGDPALGALGMVTFGAASSPGLWMAHGVHRFLARGELRLGRSILAAGLVAGAAVVLVRPMLGPGAEAECHTNSPQASAPAAPEASP